MAQEFVILVCRGDERPPAKDVEAADLILKVKKNRVSVLSSPGIHPDLKPVVRNPVHE